MTSAIEFEEVLSLPEDLDVCAAFYRPAQPWEMCGHRLISWLDVLQFSAGAFFSCGRALRMIRQDCVVASATVMDGEAVFVMAQTIDSKARLKALSWISTIESEFRKIGLSITAETVKELGERLQDGGKNFQWLHDQTEAIERLADKELKGKLFLYVPPERARFWPTSDEPHAFGRAVSDSFPSSTFDANSAGVCIATMQSTAAVFHLMRVLEIGLTALGKRFGVSLAHTNWAPAIEQIQKRINDLHKDPDWKEISDYKNQQEFYAQAASHFDTLKTAWRNHTMHVRDSKYTEGEAERIFENVKAFMEKLAARGLREESPSEA